MTPAEIDVPHALVRVLDVVTTEHAPFWQVQSPLAKEGPGGE